MASVLSIQFDLVPRDSALVCSWIYESNGMNHGCPRTRMIFCLMSGDSTSRDFALICSCSSKTGVKFDDRYIIEQWRQVRQTRLSHQSNLHSKAMESLALVVQHNMGCHRRAASCSEKNVTQSLFIFTSTAIPIYLSLGRNTICPWNRKILGPNDN